MPRFIFLAIAIAVLLFSPVFLGSYQLGMLQTALIMALFAVAFNLLSGQGGMLSFGHAAYFAAGGFGAIYAMRFAEAGTLSIPTPLLPLAGALVAGLFGLIAGLFATRRSGVYFSMVTLAIAELLHGIAPAMETTFGGESGISSMRMPWLSFDYGSETEVYYTVLVWVLAGIGILYLYNHTLFGRLTIGLRENERRLSFLGFNTHATKVIVFAVSAALSGLAGGLLVFVNESMNYAAFGMGYSSAVVMYTFVGGASLFLGPALGALVFSLLGSYLTDVTQNWLLYQGLIFVLVMMFFRDGLADLLMRIISEIKDGARRQLVRRLRQGIGGLIATSGAVMFIELVSAIRAREYLTQLASADGWPSVRVFAMSWRPDHALTWILPVLLMGIGTALCLRLKTPPPLAAAPIPPLSKEPAK